MKRFLFLITLVAACVAANAKFYVGGTIGVQGSESAVQFSLVPDGGYQFNEKWAVGATLPFRFITNGDRSTFGVGILPYGRFTFAKAGIVDFFGEYYIGSGFILDYPGVETGLRPGLKVNFNDKFSLIFRTTLIGYSFYDKSYISYGINGGAEIGFSISF